MPRRAYLGRGLLLAVFLFPLGSVAPAYAQDVTEVTLKGAFLFNFARFIEWPAASLPPDGPLSACVFGDRAVGEALARAVRGKTVGRRTVVVTTIPATGSLPACHLLYLSGVPPGRIAEIVGAVADTSVLTVSDVDAFTRLGGIIQFFVDRGKLRFRVNARAARRARLQISSQLLALAEVVEHDPPSLQGSALDTGTPSYFFVPSAPSLSVHVGQGAAPAHVAATRDLQAASRFPARPRH